MSPLANRPRLDPLGSDHLSFTKTALYPDHLQPKRHRLGIRRTIATEP